MTMSTEMKWKSFLTPNYVTSKVGETELNFYPVSLKVAFRLRCIGTPLAKALTALFSGGDSDSGKIIRDFKDAESGEMGSETIFESINVDVARFRAEQQAQAIDELISAITDEKNLMVIGEVITDSLREVFPSRPAPASEIQDFMDAVDAPALMQLLAGVGKANVKVFGPLGEALSAKVRAAVESKLAPEGAETPGSPEAPAS